MKSHKTKNIAVKHADVDINIIPLVQWLNKFESVFTEYSCEGDEQDINYTPYVAFIANDDDILYILNCTAKWYGMFTDNVKFETEIFKGVRRYVMRFKTKKLLLAFQDYIKAHASVPLL